MRRLMLELRVSGADPSNIQTRAWIDPSVEGALESEIELKLKRTAHGWVGEFAMPSSTCFYYRLGLRVLSKASWSLSIRDIEQDGEVLTDGDVVDVPKTWIFGSCKLMR